MAGFISVTTTLDGLRWSTLTLVRPATRWSRIAVAVRSCRRWTSNSSRRRIGRVQPTEVVIPQTLGALAAFLALVAPGIVFELRRERRRARRTETAFREASRVALGSLVFTLASVLLLTGAQQLASLARLRLFVGPEEWLAKGEAYAHEHVTLILVSAAVELSLACALAVGFDAVLARRRREAATVRQYTAWTEALRADRPTGSKAWVHVFLEGGSSFFGYVRSFTPSGPIAERELVLEGESLTYQGRPLDGSEGTEKKVIGGSWHRVVIAGSKVTYLRVCYLTKDGELVRDPAHRLAPSDEVGDTAADIAE